MGGRLIDRVRDRYTPVAGHPLLRRGRSAPRRPVEVFIDDVVERWDCAAAWIESHLVSLRAARAQSSPVVEGVARATARRARVTKAPAEGRAPPRSPSVADAATAGARDAVAGAMVGPGALAARRVRTRTDTARVATVLGLAAVATEATAVRDAMPSGEWCDPQSACDAGRAVAVSSDGVAAPFSVSAPAVRAPWEALPAQRAAASAGGALLRRDDVRATGARRADAEWEARGF